MIKHDICPTTVHHRTYLNICKLQAKKSVLELFLVVFIVLRWFWRGFKIKKAGFADFSAPVGAGLVSGLAVLLASLVVSWALAVRIH